MATHAGRVVLITGASAGIGAALARELARDGDHLVLAARREDRLRHLAREIETTGRDALAVACDVTRDGDPERAVAVAVERHGRLDIAVANAGFGVAGRFDELGSRGLPPATRDECLRRPPHAVRIASRTTEDTRTVRGHRQRERLRAYPRDVGLLHEQIRRTRIRGVDPWRAGHERRVGDAGEPRLCR